MEGEQSGHVATLIRSPAETGYVSRSLARACKKPILAQNSESRFETSDSRRDSRAAALRQKTSRLPGGPFESRCADLF